MINDWKRACADLTYITYPYLGQLGTSSTHRLALYSGILTALREI